MKSKRKFKGKTLKQWAAFAGRRKAKTYAADIYLHEYEEEVILRKMREQLVWGEKVVTAKALMGRYPDLFDPKHLPRAMKRMADRKLGITDVGSRLFGGSMYRLTEDLELERAKEAANAAA